MKVDLSKGTENTAQPHIVRQFSGLSLVKDIFEQGRISPEHIADWAKNRVKQNLAEVEALSNLNPFNGKKAKRATLDGILSNLAINSDPKNIQEQLRRLSDIEKSNKKTSFSDDLREVIGRLPSPEPTVIHVYPNGNRYEGESKEGKLCGHGVVSFVGDGTWVDTQWQNDCSIGTLSNLGDLKFLGLLTGMTQSSVAGYDTGIMSEFLQQQALKDPENYQGVSEALHSTQNFLLSSDLKANTESVFQNISTGRSQLLPFNTVNHSMGLNIVPVDKDFIFLDIFNSGAGLDKYHSSDLERKKYQTLLRIRVPREQVTRKLIRKLMRTDKKFATTDQVYEAILGIPGAQREPIPEDQAVWQTIQKTGNCSLEWMFAYLKNTLKNPAYTQMRIALFDAGLAAAKQAEWRPPGVENPESYKVLLEFPKMRARGWFTLSRAKEELLCELERKKDKRLSESTVSRPPDVFQKALVLGSLNK